VAISQNVGTMVTALLPALYATVAPPGSADVPITIATITFGVTLVSAIAAWSARESYRIRLDDLGDPNAVAMPKSEYDRMRSRSIAVATLFRPTARKTRTTRALGRE